ncbi:hypothetical protein COV16_06375 [Candidatus Woesearchaeota archaeon CG10_big_fil_rev_8_21_14_0_10_34_8]|nr:MAG: hypothetical protein COV16_06375 [Candidatus Woesearchaeota archaeon CG10_big_fil_rev_8_21_14_0_10_34_8]
MKEQEVSTFTLILLILVILLIAGAMYFLSKNITSKDLRITDTQRIKLLNSLDKKDYTLFTGEDATAIYDILDYKSRRLLAINWDPEKGVLGAKNFVNLEIPITSNFSNVAIIGMYLKTQGKQGGMHLYLTEYDGDSWVSYADYLHGKTDKIIFFPTNKLSLASWSTGDKVADFSSIKSLTIGFFSDDYSTAKQQDIMIDNIFIYLYQREP